MNRTRWILVGLLGLCVLGACVGAALLAQNIPGVARLFRGGTAEPAALATLRPTFTPRLPTATLTAMPTLTATPLPAAPTQTEAPPATAIEPGTATALPPTATPTPSAVPPTPAPTSRPEWLAFETKRGAAGDYEIFLIASDGSHLTNLTDSWADDVAPVWSPDGRRIAFVSLRDSLTGKYALEKSSIYLLDFDPVAGASIGEPFRLTDGQGNDGWPTWSPDGRQVAFESDRSGNWEIWLINADGSGLVNLTRSPEDERYPAWSPDGKTMAFTSERSGNYDLWLLDVAQTLQGPGNLSPRQLTTAPKRDRYAMWSPDGDKIAFNSNRDGDQEIYLIGADGSDPTNVSRSPESIEGLADWSPDGRRLVLYSDRPGNKDLFIVDLASGRWTNITGHPASDEFCTWAP